MGELDFAALMADIPRLEAADPAAAQACSFARQYEQWVGGLVRPLQSTSSPLAVNQAKLLLTDKYFAWRAVVPASHRNRLAPVGHRCIFHVFLETYERLLALELALTPPPLTPPPAQRRL